MTTFTKAAWRLYKSIEHLVPTIRFDTASTKDILSPASSDAGDNATYQ